MTITLKPSAVIFALLFLTVMNMALQIPHVYPLPPSMYFWRSSVSTWNAEQPSCKVENDQVVCDPQGDFTRVLSKKERCD